MPNEKIHDIDVFRMEGDTPETPKDPTPQRHCAAEFDGLGSKAGGEKVKRWRLGVGSFLQTFLNQYHSKKTIPLHPK